MQKMMNKKDEWEKMGQENKKIAEAYAVQQTQALCDSYYIKWLEKK